MFEFIMFNFGWSQTHSLQLFLFLVIPMLQGVSIFLFILVGGVGLFMNLNLLKIFIIKCSFDVVSTVTVYVFGLSHVQTGVLAFHFI